jgi:hypothetical protein
VFEGERERKSRRELRFGGLWGLFVSLVTSDEELTLNRTKGWEKCDVSQKFSFAMINELQLSLSSSGYIADELFLLIRFLPSRMEKSDSLIKTKLDFFVVFISISCRV